LKESEYFHKRAIETLKRQERKEVAAREYMTLAANSQLLGKCDDAKRNTKEALALARGQMIVANATLILAGCDDLGQAQSLLDDMRKEYPQNFVIATIIAPVFRAETEAKRGNIDEALRILESLRGYDMGMITGVSNTYWRGNLYLKQRRGNEAAAEFKKIIERRGIDPFSPAHTLAHLGLGRAAVINGDISAARKSYQDFFAMWKDADQDLPVLAEARKEYEQFRVHG
jgi:tetratricopeptide (TPR) repeat protein